MKIIYKSGSVSIMEIRDTDVSEYFVYAGDKLLRVCPSIGMAHEIAAGAVDRSP